MKATAIIAHIGPNKRDMLTEGNTAISASVF